MKKDIPGLIPARQAWSPGYVLQPCSQICVVTWGGNMGKIHGRNTVIIYVHMGYIYIVLIIYNIHR